MKRILIALAATAILPLAAAAQPHAGGVVFSDAAAHQIANPVFKGVYIANRNTGTWSTLFEPNATYAPGGWTQAVMDCDNRSYIHGTNGGNASFGLQNHGVFRYDPTTGNVTTIVRDPAVFGYNGPAVAGVHVTQDGDYLLTAAAGLYRADGSGSFRTILVAPASTTQAFNSDLTKDVDTGRVIFTGPPFFPFFPGTVYAVDTDEAVTSIQTTPGSAPVNWVKQLSTGDFLGTNRRDSSLYRFNASTSPTVVTTLDFGVSLSASFGAGRCLFENQSTSNPQLIVYGAKGGSGTITTKLEFLDPQNGWAVTNTLVLATSGTSPSHGRGSGFNDRSNYIQTVKTASGKWDVKLSVPAYPGKNYALIVGANGIRPGVGIDSRRIWLNPDPLVWASAYNLLGAVFNPGPGALDTNGEATGSIDLSSLGLPTGTRFLTHLMLLVLDPSAPSGIAFITEPECFKVSS